MILWLLSSIALAYPEIRLAPASTRVVEDYRAYKEKKGSFTSDLACTEFAEGMLMCFRYVDAQKLPYVLESDLERWDATLEQLQVSATDKSVQYVNKDRYTFQTVENVKGGYWASASKDGWDAAALLHPERLKQMLGAEPLVAMPQAGMLLFWGQGNPPLNKAVAIGVKEVYNQASRPISPYIYQWSQGKWVVWGQAVERTP